MIQKCIKQKLRDRDEVICAFLRIPDPSVAEIMALAGVELLIIDMEHYVFNAQTVQNIARAAEIYHAECLVRISDADHGSIGRLLDMGVSGVLLADAVDSKQVQSVVHAVKYPPVGTRGASTDSRAGKYGYYTDDITAYPKAMNDRTIIGVILETKTAIADLGGILAIPEVDFVSVGTMDLSFAYGVPGQVNHPVIAERKRELYRRIAASGKSALDKTPNLDALQSAKRAGINCYYVDSDAALLKKGLDAIIGLIRDSSGADRR